MKLWLLTRMRMADYDQHSGFVVRATNEATARVLAYDVHRDKVWLDGVFGSTCGELTAEGKSGIVLEDFRAG